MDLEGQEEYADFIDKKLDGTVGMERRTVHDRIKARPRNRSNIDDLFSDNSNLQANENYPATSNEQLNETLQGK